MSSYIWVLAITVLGSTPEHHYFPKYETKQECLQALENFRQEFKVQKKQTVGSCRLVLKDAK